MIPNKINQSFMQGMQVLSEAKINGSKITISKSNSIHTQTLFEKIFFRDKNITNEKNNNLNRNYEKAKNAVAAALENEIKISIMLSTNGIPAADPSLDHEIENISKSLVNKTVSTSH